jgi:hypothetical protein
MGRYNSNRDFRHPPARSVPAMLAPTRRSGRASTAARLATHSSATTQRSPGSSELCPAPRPGEGGLERSAEVEQGHPHVDRVPPRAQSLSL